MEKEPESITQTRVRLYQKALAELRAENAENAAKERDSELAKKSEAEPAKEPDGPGSDRAHSTEHEGSDKA
jgi:hypothetical protein